MHGFGITKKVYQGFLMTGGDVIMISNDAFLCQEVETIPQETT
ncbi:calcineurin-like phosphoesterase [Bartonella silvatica]|uniref:Calcineurin-like phosphoesterase n=1 Tax=Bartonella silvatica TaxID=357760 RepID=A0ABV2HI78_9HYPH